MIIGFVLFQQIFQLILYGFVAHFDFGPVCCPDDDMGSDWRRKEDEENAQEQSDAEHPFHDEKQEDTDEGEQDPYRGAL